MRGSNVMKDFNYSSLDDGTIKITKYVGDAEEVEIPSMINGKNVTTIDDSTFEGRNTIKSVTIPDSVTTIGHRAFGNCKSLKNIDVSVDNSNYISENGVLFDKNKTKLIQYPRKKKDKTYIIPEGVTTIGDLAFMNCNSLISVAIPDSVITIGDFAFERCRHLENITIPDSVTTIGDFAFRDCNSLISVTISDSVTTIGNAAFALCGGIKNITIPNSVTIIGYDAFRGCGSLTSITIPNSVTTIGDRAFELCRHLENITIPESVTTIGDFAFGNCKSLESVTIPDSVTTIGDFAFGYRWSISDRRRKVKNFHIYCHKNTPGEKYAIDNGFDYTLLD